MVIAASTSTATGTPATITGAAGAAAGAGQSWAAVAAGSPQSTGYDPLRFYVRATDVRGHSDQLSLKVAPDVMAMLHKLVNCGDFPEYETPHDVLRDGAAHLVEMRNSQIGDPSLREAQSDAFARHAFAEFLEGTTTAVEHWRGMQVTLQAALVGLSGDQAWGQVWETCRRAEELADPSPEPYRTMVMEIVKRWRKEVPETYRLG
jgi:hypothetical protein